MERLYGIWIHSRRPAWFYAGGVVFSTEDIGLARAQLVTHTGTWLGDPPVAEIKIIGEDGQPQDLPDGLCIIKVGGDDEQT